MSTWQFLSTLSLRRATISMVLLLLRTPNFYPRSPCGERPCILTILTCTVLFLSTLSLRRATSSPRVTMSTWQFLSTLSLRRATIVMVGLLMCNLYFYPRSPCGERQAGKHAQPPRQLISIHALLAESDPAEHHASNQQEIFLSTLSLRRATRGRHIIDTRAKNFYPRSPCGERLANGVGL